MKTKVLVICGPTATGKSDLAVRLAKKFNGEVISADSRQVYRGLNIGTGKITRKEMRGVRHHLLNVASANQRTGKRFTVQDYKESAERAIADIVSRGKLPIICGGTGFYIDALVDGTEFPAVKADDKLRAKLSKKSPLQLLAMLKKHDPRRWRTIDANPSDKKNARRLVRAIEVALGSKGRKNGVEGRRACYIRSDTDPESGRAFKPSLQKQYNLIFIGLQLPRPELRRRIRARLISRLESGMIAEARRLHSPRTARNPNGGLSWKRMEELGLEYRYLSRYLRGLITKKEMVEKLDTEIGRYAKRQMTWFRRNKRIKWFGPDKKKAATEAADHKMPREVLMSFPFRRSPTRKADKRASRSAQSAKPSRS